MSDVIKAIEEMTERDIVLYYWIETTQDGKPRFVRGRKRTMDESILLCNGDTRRYMEYLKCSNE